MIGYHFTAARNWPSIQSAGLQPYDLNKPDLHRFYDEVRGVFIFPDDCVDDLDRIGCIYYQSATKRDFGVVELEVMYDREDLKPLSSLFKDGDTMEIMHTGTIGLDWTYHVRPLRVLSGPVSPERVRLRATYDIRDVLVSAPVRLPVLTFT